MSCNLTYLRLGILVSGAGTTMKHVSDACERKEINGTVCVVVSNNPNAPALKLASNLGIPNFHIEGENCDNKIVELFQKHNVNLVVLAGYLKLVTGPILKNFKVINIHPSLLPKFGGKGMFGKAVYEAVLASKEPETGVTVHLVNEKYDEGPILGQRTIDISPNETVETLEKKVKELGYALLIQILKDSL